MAKKWNVVQVVALAPDAASRKAGRGLAASPRWSQLGSNESLVWGRFQGSAKEPYQVTVDLTEPAFHCSCPSRKIPCKHALALLLYLVDHPEQRTEAEAPKSTVLDFESLVRAAFAHPEEDTHRRARKKGPRKDK